MVYPNLSIYNLKNEKAIVSACSKIDVMSHYLDFYIESGVETVPPNCFDKIKKLISFCGAFTTFLPADAVFGCTVSLPLSQRKLFAMFDVKKKTFVARSHTWFPKKYDKNPKLAVQKVSESFNLNSVSMVDCIEEYEDENIINKLVDSYLKSDGEAALKAFEGKSDFFVVSANLELPLKELEKYIQHKKPEKEFLYNFECGCNSQKIFSFFSTISKDDIDYLFGDGDEIKTECPRCGFNYVFKRGSFEKNK
ncbi:MAG: Hsp33 family molecular chaperone HslO [bacterium]